MMYGHGVGWFGITIGLIITVIIVIGVTVLAIWAVRGLSGYSRGSVAANKSVSSAREIARVRYARGEISREEYQMIVSDLDN